MTIPVNLFPSARSSVRTGGTSVVAFYAPVTGFYIKNPALPAEQGIPTAEMLYLNLIGPAVPGAPGTIEVLPGSAFKFLKNSTTVNVWVNAKTSGHVFSAFAIQPPQSPPTRLKVDFPPVGPQSLQNTIKAYPYNEYNDDDDILAFFDTYNSYTQEFVDWFNTVNLPIYTDIPSESVGLLDWVGNGLYGVARPALFYSDQIEVGPLNTYAFNAPPAIGGSFDQDVFSQTGVASDDVYKRTITWNVYRGDGRQVTVSWIKRRILRFLYGVNGTDYEGDTSQVSVIFGANDSLAITIITGRTRMAASAAYDTFAFNSIPFNHTDVEPVSVYLKPDLAEVFREAIETGALELPFQYNVTCRIGIMGTR